MDRISALEREYVEQVLASSFRSSAGGIMTKRLEETFASLINSPFAIAFVNGTATMHSALVAAGVGPGDEVIVPPLTMASTAFAVIHAGAVPIFADVDPDTWNIDPDAADAAVSDRTKAVIPVALYGLAPDLDAIMALADRHGLFVLEDDAECLLGHYNGRVVGSIGHAASFSFQSSKHVTAGEGGMVVTRDEDLALRIRRFNSLGYAAVGTTKARITRQDIQDPECVRHVTVGFNYRMPELCAAVALAQIERASELVDVRMASARRFAEAASGCSWFIPQSVPNGYTNSYWTWAARLADEAPVDWHGFRDQFRAFGGDGIYAAWRLNYLEPGIRSWQPVVGVRRQDWGPGLCPVAEHVQRRIFQFKTNYWDSSYSARQAEILAETIDMFGR